MLEFRILRDRKLIQNTVFSKGSILIGRSSDNDLVLQDPFVSRLHAVIEQKGEEVRLEDRSSNGILVNGQRVAGAISLPPQCRLEIYPFEIECLRRQDDHTSPLPTAQATVPLNLARETLPNRSAIVLHYGLLVGESSPMQQVYRLIEDVTDAPATVLVRGEHGTGKELVARAIHEAGHRRQQPFITVNCAAIPVDLLESELFGYEKGAFTGAQTAQKGKVEEAHKGTLFLDEIGELSRAAQAKLLRFLQQRSFMRLGSAREIPVDVRVIAATNRDLEKAVEEERFRADLYYRIKVFQISLPPLRDCVGDILLLATHFLRKLTGELGLSSEPILTPAAAAGLESVQWPGNIRELENILYSAVLRSRPPYVLEEQILFEDIPTWERADLSSEQAPMDAINKQLLLRVLKQNHWDTAKAAEVLRVSRGTVYYKLKKYGINVKDASRQSLNLNR